jgi:sodium/proline symporter
MTRNGALAGMLVGALTVIIWRNGAWFGLYEMVPGFLLSGVAIVLFSLLDKAPSMRMQQDFAQMEAEMANPGVSLTAPVAD